MLENPLKAWLDERCAAAGVTLEWHCVKAPGFQYREVFRSSRNVIAWNCRRPHAWLTERQQNVLHVENTLLSQRTGIFADHGGFFSNSNLCRKQTWRERYPHAQPEFFAKREFGWKAFSGGDPQGPVLVALQNRPDCNLRLEYPLAEGARDKVVRTLELLREHLPTGRPVLVRPHPRERADFKDGGVWRDDWRLDMEGAFAERLPQCSALVTVNSTCASEAALLGVPTATLGTGAFSGSGVTLECAQAPALLAGLADFQPDLERCRAYTCAILGRHFIPYSIKGDRPCLEFESWLRACHLPADALAGERFKYEGIYGSPGSHPRYGHTNHGRRALPMLLRWKAASVVDVGCGHNEFIQAFRGRRPGVPALGVDFACPGADVRADAHHLPFADKRHDVLTSFDMLEHVPPDLVDDTLAEMARVSRRFIFSISSRESKARWQGLSLHPTIRPQEWWKERIAAVGGADVRETGGYLTGRWRAV